MIEQNAASGIQQCPQGFQLSTARSLPFPHISGTKNHGNSGQQVYPISNEAYPQNIRPQNMNRQRFCIDLKYIPDEAFPLLDAIGVRCDRANMYQFWKSSHSQVAKAMLSLNPPVQILNLKKWKPGHGFCLGEGATDRRFVSSPGNFACYVYDSERFCVDYNCIPRESLSLVGNLDVHLSGSNCKELMWHFPKDHLAAFAKALEMFIEIQDNPSMQSILEPTVINSVDGTIIPANDNFGRAIPIPVHIMNYHLFYIEVKCNIPPWACKDLLMLTNAHYDRRRGRWHFINKHYYAVKSIFASLNPPGVLGYMPALTITQWKSLMPKSQPEPRHLENRALALLPKFGTVNPTDSQSSIRSAISYATQPSRANQQSCVSQSYDINSSISLTQSVNTTSNPSYLPVLKIPKSKLVQSPKVVKMESVVPLTEVGVSNELQSQIISEKSVVPANCPPSLINSANFSMSKSMQPRVILQGPLRKTTLSETQIMKNVPGFAIIDNLAPDTPFEQKSKGVYFAEMKIIFPPTPDNLGSHWGVLLRLVRSIHGVQVRNSNLNLTLSISNNEDWTELAFRSRGSGFHLNIADYIFWGEENTISLTVEVDSGLADFESTFMKFIGVVRNRNSSELLEELRQGSRTSIENTKNMVRNSMKGGILPDGSKLPLSLICPLGNSRIETPCRSTRCNHCSCFDATNFFNLYAESLDWKCPICASKITMNDLRIDGFLTMVLKHKRAENPDNDLVKIDSSGRFLICSSGDQNHGSSNEPTITHISDTVADITENEIEQVDRTPSESDSDESTLIISDSATEENETSIRMPVLLVKEEEFERKKTKRPDDSDSESPDSPESKKRRLLEEDSLKEKDSKDE